MPHVTGKIGDVDMTAGTAVFAVNGIGKSLDGNFVAVAAEAIGRVNCHSLFGANGQNPDQHENQ